MAKYLTLFETGFGFKDSEVNEITEQDILIADDIYLKFFELQEQGKQFKIINPQGQTFEEIFEEVEYKIIQEKTELDTLKEENNLLKQELADIKAMLQELLNRV